MIKTIFYISIVILLSLFWFTCVPPGTELPTPEPEEKNRTEIKFLNFDQDAEGLVTFFSNDKRTLGPNGYTYWCIGGYAHNPMQTFEANLCKISGSDSGVFGLVFAARDIDNFLTVFINLHQQYIIARVTENNTVSIIRDWQINSFLNPGYAGNKIRIEYNNSTDEYAVRFNDDPVGIIFADYAEDHFTGGYYGYLAEIQPSEEFPDRPVEITFELISPLDIGLQQPQRNIH